MAPQRNEQTQDLGSPVLLDGAIELTLPCEPRQLPLIRTVAEGIATRARFSLDAAADLKMAVDEACALLLSVADPLSALQCRFFTLDREVHVTVTAPTLWSADKKSFGWRMLTALAGSLFANLSPPLARIEFTQHAS